MTSKSHRIAALLRQTAVYWGNPLDDGYGGKTFDSPVELPVRWEETHELYTDAGGQEKRSGAVVYVASDVDVGGYLFLGGIDDLSSLASDSDPLEEPNTWEIRSFEKIPDRNAGAFLRKVFL